MARQADRQEFITLMREEGLSRSDAMAIMRAADTLQRLGVKGCNEETTEEDARLDAEAEARIKALCAPHGVVPRCDGDPRGAVVKLKLKSGKRNDFGGDDLWCVPTREY